LAKEEKNRPGILTRAADTFDLPAEVLQGLPRLTITGGQRIIVENHQGLMDYTPQCIVVAGGKVTLKLLGNALELRAMTAEALLITGDIFNVEFIY